MVSPRNATVEEGPTTPNTKKAVQTLQQHVTRDKKAADTTAAVANWNHNVEYERGETNQRDVVDQYEYKCDVLEIVVLNDCNITIVDSDGKRSRNHYGIVIDREKQFYCVKIGRYQEVWINVADVTVAKRKDVSYQQELQMMRDFGCQPLFKSTMFGDSENCLDDQFSWEMDRAALRESFFETLELLVGDRVVVDHGEIRKQSIDMICDVRKLEFGRWLHNAMDLWLSEEQKKLTQMYYNISWVDVFDCLSCVDWTYHRPDISLIDALCLEIPRLSHAQHLRISNDSLDCADNFRQNGDYIYWPFQTNFTTTGFGHQANSLGELQIGPAFRLTNGSRNYKRTFKLILIQLISDARIMEFCLRSKSNVNNACQLINYIFKLH